MRSCAALYSSGHVAPHWSQVHRLSPWGSGSASSQSAASDRPRRRASRRMSVLSQTGQCSARSAAPVSLAGLVLNRYAGKNFQGGGFVLLQHIQPHAADEVGHLPVQADEVFIAQAALDAGRLQRGAGDDAGREITKALHRDPLRSACCVRCHAGDASTANNSENLHKRSGILVEMATSAESPALQHSLSTPEPPLRPQEHAEDQFQGTAPFSSWGTISELRRQDCAAQLAKRLPGRAGEI